MTDIVSRSFQTDRKRLDGTTKGIGVADIIASLNKQKILTSYVPAFDKVLTNKFDPSKGNRDFISQVQKMNDFKVAPNTYNPNTTMFLDANHLKTIHFAYSKSNKVSVVAENAKRKAWVPAPSAYKPDDKHTRPTVIGNYKTKDLTSGIMLDATAHGHAVPAAHYKLPRNDITSNVPASRSPDFAKTKTIRFKPMKKTDLSPTSYKPQAGFEKYTKPRALVFSVPKEKLKTYITRSVERKAWVPSPNAYKIDGIEKLITLGARKSYK